MLESDARSEKRYLIVAPVTFWWPCKNRVVHFGKGFTQDISNGGVLISARDCPSKGALVQLTIMLPQINGGGPGLAMQGEGVVIRVEHEGGRTAGPGSMTFAASIYFYPEQRRVFERISINKAAVFTKPYII